MNDRFLSGFTRKHSTAFEVEICGAGHRPHNSDPVAPTLSPVFARQGILISSNVILLVDLAKEVISLLVPVLQRQEPP